MINDDFNFEFDSSDFPVSIEKFAAYLDGNLSDDEMQRVKAVIDGDEGMQDVISNNQYIDETLSNNKPLELVLPDELTQFDFDIPQFDDSINIDGYWEELEVAACAENEIYDDSYIDSECSTDMNHGRDDVIHHTDFSSHTDEYINNDLTQEQDTFENDITEIN